MEGARTSKQYANTSRPASPCTYCIRTYADTNQPRLYARADAWAVAQVSGRPARIPSLVLSGFFRRPWSRLVPLFLALFGELRSLSTWWPRHPRPTPALTAVQVRPVHGWGVPADVATAAATGHLLTDGIAPPLVL
jgi:hypothetical protein